MLLSLKFQFDSYYSMIFRWFQFLPGSLMSFFWQQENLFELDRDFICLGLVWSHNLEISFICISLFKKVNCRNVCFVLFVIIIRFCLTNNSFCKYILSDFWFNTKLSFNFVHIFKFIVILFILSVLWNIVFYPILYYIL